MRSGWEFSLRNKNNYRSMKDPNKLISFVVAFQVIAQGCKNILVQGFPFLYSINDTLNMLVMGSALLMYIYALISTGRLSVPSQTIGILFFVGLTYAYTFALGNNNFHYIQRDILRTLVVCFFTFFLVSKLNTIEYLRLYFSKGTYFITISGVLYCAIIIVIGHNTTSEWSTYSMSMSNVLLLAVLWHLNDYFENKNKLPLIASIIGTIIIFLYGSRNPFLAIAFFICIKILFKKNGKQSFGPGVKIMFLSGIILVVSFFKEILTFIATKLQSFGLSSRMVYYFMNSDTEDITTGRAEIHDMLWNIILENPFIGYGIAGDEVVIDELSHSLYLSIFITFGLLFGSIVILYLVSMIIKAIRRTSGLNHNIIILYVCLVFPRSFTGGDIWSNDYFWFMLGLVISALNQSRRTIVKNKYINYVN